jgi:RNA ligase (TIGR02306 family)
MRKLASIQKILDINPIDGADSIEVAKILGWDVVIKKDQFKVGDLCVYCEIDSIFPEKEPFLFLKPRGMRIKTVKLKGQISQGIAFSLDILESINKEDLIEDLDVTDAIGIVKYEPKLHSSLSGIAKGNFPSYLVKTDENRVQTQGKMLRKYEGEVFYNSEKLDGSSDTNYIKDGIFGVCSRNLDLVETEDNLFWQNARNQNIEHKLRKLNRNFAIQGELIGPNIQGNKYGLKNIDFYIFNFFDIDTHSYLSLEESLKVLDIMNEGEEVKLKMVPLLDDVTIVTDIDFYCELSKGYSKLNDKVLREGIVIRHKDDPSISFKSIQKEFLLYYGE